MQSQKEKIQGAHIPAFSSTDSPIQSTHPQSKFVTSVHSSMPAHTSGAQNVFLTEESSTGDIESELSPVGQEIYEDVSKVVGGVRQVKKTVSKDEHAQRVLQGLSDILSSSSQQQFQSPSQPYTSSSSRMLAEGRGRGDDKAAALKEELNKGAKSFLILVKHMLTDRAFREVVRDVLNIGGDLVMINYDENLMKESQESHGSSASPFETSSAKEYISTGENKGAENYGKFEGPSHTETIPISQVEKLDIGPTDIAALKEPIEPEITQAAPNTSGGVGSSSLHADKGGSMANPERPKMSGESIIEGYAGAQPTTSSNELAAKPEQQKESHLFGLGSLLGSSGVFGGATSHWTSSEEKKEKNEQQETERKETERNPIHEPGPEQATESLQQIQEPQQLVAPPPTPTEISSNASGKIVIPQEKKDELINKLQKLFKIMIKEEQFKDLHHHLSNVNFLIREWIKNVGFAENREAQEKIDKGKLEEVNLSEAIPENILETVRNAKLFIESQLNAYREEGLRQGTVKSTSPNVSLDSWAKSLKPFLVDIKNDQIWDSLYSIYDESITNPDYVDTSKWRDDISKWIDNFSEVVRKYREDFQGFVEESVNVFSELPEPTLYQDVKSLQQRVKETLKKAFPTHEPSTQEELEERDKIRMYLEHDALVLLKKFKEAMSEVGVARIELNDDEMHLVVDHLRIGCENILPNCIRVVTETEFEVETKQFPEEKEKKTLVTGQIIPTISTQTTTAMQSPDQPIFQTHSPTTTTTLPSLSIIEPQKATTTTSATTIVVQETKSQEHPTTTEILPKFSHKMTVYLRDIEASATEFTWMLFMKKAGLSGGDVGLADLKVKKLDLEVCLHPFGKPGVPSVPGKALGEKEEIIDYVKCIIDDIDLRLYETKHDWLYKILVPIMKRRIKHRLEEEIELAVKDGLSRTVQGAEVQLKGVQSTLKQAVEAGQLIQ